MATGNSATRARSGRVILDVAIPLVLGALGVLIFEAPNILPKATTQLYWAGAGLLVATVALQVFRALRADRLITTTDNEVNDLRIAMKDSIAPVARLLAEMPNLSAGVKRRHVVRVADKVTSVTAYLLLAHIPRVRANVFVLNVAGDELVHESTSGEGDDPGPFAAGTVAGDIALAWTKAGGEPFIVEDTHADPRPGIRNDARYRSFVSVVIRSGDYSYGMLTVDSPVEGSFAEGSTSVEIAKVVAELLAVGYASAYPGVSAGTSS
ncbi:MULTISPECIES: hypothetical protein [Cryobacterium]|uniref:GAF domain-containing protein n=1 Tax=Cryobacterium breve TaxID=1259258 RepID=A0ABY2J490_9MICO|nr:MULTISPECIES: hypothetical protein [Cryobacterium]TFC93015.1 hypothetical protein E3T20_11190 [Cryobacterium sp. TmT3-12]TFC98868.1 hypothetical protein E3O65_06945 [Cryobacterium breve]